MSLENDVYEFIRERVVAASADPPTLAARPEIVAALAGLEVLPDEFSEIKGSRGVRLGDMVSARVAPARFASRLVDHFDALLILIVYVKIERADVKRRSTYRDEVVAIAEALSAILFASPSLNVLATGEARVRNSRPLRLPRGSDNIDGRNFAVANVQMVINETGEVDFARRER